MGFKDNSIRFQWLDIALIEPNPAHPRQYLDEAGLKGLVNSISRKGLIHPLVVQPADAHGRYRLIVGERRRQAAVLAGEKTVPVLIRACDPDEVLEVQVFENLGLGIRAALEPRDMANAIQRIAGRFATQEAAAEQFGRSSNWLEQATAAAKLSPKVSALLDSGKISSTATAVQLEKLARKNEAKADSLIGRIEQLPVGEKLPRQAVDHALCEAGVRRRKKEIAAPAAAPGVSAAPTSGVPAWEELPDAVVAPPAREGRRRVSPGKVRQVAEILGLVDGDEEEILDRLIDEFLALKAEGSLPPA